MLMPQMLVAKIKAEKTLGKLRAHTHARTHLISWNVKTFTNDNRNDNTSEITYVYV